ncbi:hypothetical protein PSZ55_23815, partial [Shigella sonnei]|nr:hypothetical protein [Shigella sonnei]
LGRGLRGHLRMTDTIDTEHFFVDGVGHAQMTDTIDNEHFFVRKNGLLYATKKCSLSMVSVICAWPTPSTTSISLCVRMG